MSHVGTIVQALACGCTVTSVNEREPTIGTLKSPWTPRLCLAHERQRLIAESLRTRAGHCIGALVDVTPTLMGENSLRETLVGFLGCVAEDIEGATDAADLAARLMATIDGVVNGLANKSGVNLDVVGRPVSELALFLADGQPGVPS